MDKRPFISKEKLEAICAEHPTPFHLYDEAEIRRRARALNQAFSWNPGFKEYFAVKATPNPWIVSILAEEGCGCDCATGTELALAEACGVTGADIMLSRTIARRATSAPSSTSTASTWSPASSAPLTASSRRWCAAA